MRLIESLFKPDLSKHITASLILGHDEYMRGSDILAFILLEQLFKVAPCMACSRFGRDTIFFILPNDPRFKDSSGKR